MKIFSPLTVRVNLLPIPLIQGTIIVPGEYLTNVTNLCSSCRGVQTAIEYIDQQRIRLEYTFPLAEILTKFFHNLKRVTSGKLQIYFIKSGAKISKVA